MSVTTVGIHKLYDHHENNLQVDQRNIEKKHLKIKHADITNNHSMQKSCNPQERSRNIKKHSKIKDLGINNDSV